MPHRLPRLLAAALLAAPALGELDRRRTSDKTHWSCSVLVTSGRGLHESEWQAMPSSDLSDGRPAFTAVVGGVPLYLRHEVLDAEAGDAAWVVSRSPARGASRSTWSAYAQSWAVGPHMVADIHADHGVGAGLGGAAGWHVPRHEGDDPDYGEWERASPQPAVYCAGPERGVHMSIPPDEAGGAHETSGFYLETGDVQVRVLRAVQFRTTLRATNVALRSVATNVALRDQCCTTTPPLLLTPLVPRRAPAPSSPTASTTCTRPGRRAWASTGG